MCCYEFCPRHIASTSYMLIPIRKSTQNIFLKQLKQTIFLHLRIDNSQRLISTLTFLVSSSYLTCPLGLSIWVICLKLKIYNQIPESKPSVSPNSLTCVKCMTSEVIWGSLSFLSHHLTINSYQISPLLSFKVIVSFPDL